LYAGRVPSTSVQGRARVHRALRADPRLAQLLEQQQLAPPRLVRTGRE
jgi:hypothetical protein